MRYRIYLSLFLITLLGCRGVHAADPGYRVELLVLRHLDGQAESLPQTTLRDFSAALDLLRPPAESAAAEPAPADGTPVPATAAQPLAAEEQPAAADPATQIVLVETRSDKMQLAWQRLRASSAYRPELYLSWQQPGQQPFPLIRLHDQQVLIEDDPYAGLRMHADSAGNQDVVAVTGISATANAAGDAGDGAVTLPEPTRFYRLDGSARLRRSRFLHLDLDIEYREPLSADVAQSVAQSEPPAATKRAYEETARRPAAFLVHALRQSRQVQIDHMEYFDGPVFGVLALVSRIEVAAGQGTAAEPASE